MKNIWNKAIVLMLLLLLSACSGNSPDVKEEFSKQLPQPWQLGSFKITATQDTGTKVSPRSEYRFVAEISPKENLHNKIATLRDVDILNITSKKNEKSPVHGVAHSVFTAGAWQTTFSIEKSPDYSSGKPISAFGQNSVVFGSSEYNSLINSFKNELSKMESDYEKAIKDIEGAENEHKALAEEANKKIATSNQQIAALNQGAQQQRNELNQKHNADMRQINEKYGKENAEKNAAARATYEAAIREIDKEYRLGNADIVSERTQLTNWVREEQGKVNTAHRDDLQSATKKMDKASYITYKANLDEQLRTNLASVGQAYNEKMNVLREKEIAAEKARLGEIEQARGEYSIQAEMVGKQITVQREAEIEPVTKGYNDNLAKINNELQTVQKEQQNLWTLNNNQLNEKRIQIDKLRQQVYASRTSLDNSRRSLAFLEKYGQAGKEGVTAVIGGAGVVDASLTGTYEAKEPGGDGRMSLKFLGNGKVFFAVSEQGQVIDSFEGTYRQDGERVTVNSNQSRKSGFVLTRKGSILETTIEKDTLRFVKQ